MNILPCSRCILSNVGNARIYLLLTLIGILCNGFFCWLFGIDGFESTWLAKYYRLFNGGYDSGVMYFVDFAIKSFTILAILFCFLVLLILIARFLRSLFEGRFLHAGFILLMGFSYIASWAFWLILFGPSVI